MIGSAESGVFQYSVRRRESGQRQHRILNIRKVNFFCRRCLEFLQLGSALSTPYSPHRFRRAASAKYMSSKENSRITMAEYRQLGKSGLRVSVPILGAMSFGDKRWQEWVIEEEKVGAELIEASLTRRSGSSTAESGIRSRHQYGPDLVPFRSSG